MTEIALNSRSGEKTARATPQIYKHRSAFTVCINVNYKHGSASPVSKNIIYRQRSAFSVNKNATYEYKSAEISASYVSLCFSCLVDRYATPGLRCGRRLARRNSKCSLHFRYRGLFPLANPLKYLPLQTRNSR